MIANVKCLGLVSTIVLALSCVLFAQQPLSGWGHVTNATTSELVVDVLAGNNTQGTQIRMAPGSSLNLLRSPRYTIHAGRRKFQVSIKDVSQFDRTKQVPVWLRQFYSFQQRNGELAMTAGPLPQWRSSFRSRYAELRQSRSIPNVFVKRQAPLAYMERLLVRSAEMALGEVLVKTLPSSQEDYAAVGWGENKLLIQCIVPREATIKVIPTANIEFIKSVVSTVTGLKTADIDITTWDGIVRSTVSGDRSILSGRELRPNLVPGNNVNLGVVEAALSLPLSQLPVSMDSVVSARTAHERKFESDWRFLTDSTIPPMLSGQHVQWKVEITVSVPQDSPNTLHLHCILRIRHKYRSQNPSQFVELDRATTLSINASKNGFVNWKETLPDATFDRIQKDIVLAVRNAITQPSNRRPPLIP